MSEVLGIARSIAVTRFREAGLFAGNFIPLQDFFVEKIGFWLGPTLGPIHSLLIAIRWRYVTYICLYSHCNPGKYLC